MDYELTLFDRIEVIKTAYEKYDLEHNAYISFSGGKDSTVLHYLIDEAVPNNRIPRVFINTGIEYNDIVKFVRNLASKDNRIHIIAQKQPIKKVLETYGYPFKSKLHSKKVDQYQRNKEVTEYLKKYINREKQDNGKRTHFECPILLKYQFTPSCKLRISHLCCEKLKKEPMEEWKQKNSRKLIITGMKKNEGGARESIKGCVFTDSKGNVIKFHPLAVITDDFEDWYIRTRNIKLASLYYPPFNFTRTGCKGCPFSLDLAHQLEVMERLLPAERKQCEIIWKPVYEEYRRIGYRLTKSEQIKLFDD